mgnify:CR=1 FL=1
MITQQLMVAMTGEKRSPMEDGRGTRKQVGRYAGTLAGSFFLATRTRNRLIRTGRAARSRGDEEQAREMDGSGLSACVWRACARVVPLVSINSRCETNLVPSECFVRVVRRRKAKRTGLIRDIVVGYACHGISIRDQLEEHDKLGTIAFRPSLDSPRVTSTRSRSNL